jgi:hypothetical protein
MALMSDDGWTVSSGVEKPCAGSPCDAPTEADCA